MILLFIVRPEKKKGEARERFYLVQEWNGWRSDPRRKVVEKVESTVCATQDMVSCVNPCLPYFRQMTGPVPVYGGGRHLD